MTRLIHAAGWLTCAALLLAAFDHAMRADAQTLCSRDDTAYPECVP